MKMGLSEDDRTCRRRGGRGLGRLWLSGEKDIAAAARRLVAKSRRLGGAGRAYLAIFAPRCVPIEGASTS